MARPGSVVIQGKVLFSLCGERSPSLGRISKITSDSSLFTVTALPSAYEGYQLHHQPFLAVAACHGDFGVQAQEQTPWGM